MRFETPGRFSGSYEMPDMESVVAPFIFWLISSGESMIDIRDLGSASDFDIFCVGFLSDMTLFPGTENGQRKRELKIICQVTYPQPLSEQ